MNQQILNEGIEKHKKGMSDNTLFVNPASVGFTANKIR